MDFAKEVDASKVLSIIASTHIDELEKYGLIDKYIDHFLLFRNNGFNIWAIEVAYPPLASKVERYKKLFKKKGVFLEFQPFWGIFEGKQYPQAYSKEELILFGLSRRQIKWCALYLKWCNAGYNSAVILNNGDIVPCYFASHEIIGNIYTSITFNDELKKCPVAVCTCPPNKYYTNLFHKALREKISFPLIPYIAHYAFLWSLYEISLRLPRRKK